MGAGQSRSEPSEKIFRNETPIQFSGDVVNTLADRSASTDPTPERQATIDEHIRSRIHTELGRLRAEEENVQAEIARALEKENLDRERGMAGAADDAGGVKSSAALMGDLDEIRTKVDRFKERRGLKDMPAVKAGADGVLACYQKNPTTPLDCWREVERFKTAVSQAERDFFKSLQY
ncbi:hypothetical protein BD626DRAFT_518777 [Schizophyllum amplum]|uniref:DUF1690-domain-containing protein n=1 Tax=Schizophyllum amplum TaxID=97359 RepID=A0A550BVT0_9AGAR|nr:hypothetical protein BD626DRAFT_518777 [Auriculariopsis ampla]